MDQMADRMNDEVHVPDRCPRCGKSIITYIGSAEDGKDKYVCPDCGELYYDDCLDIFRIRRIYNE